MDFTEKIQFQLDKDLVHNNHQVIPQKTIF